MRAQPVFWAFVLGLSACVPDLGQEAGGSKVVGGGASSGHAAVGVIDTGPPYWIDCTATLVAPRVVVSVKACVLEGTRASDIRFYLGARLDPQSEPVANGLEMFYAGALSRDANAIPDEYRNLIAIVLDRDPGVQPIPWRRTAMGQAEVGQRVEVVGFGQTRIGARDWGVRRVATSTIWSVHRNDPIFVTTRRAGDGTHCDGADRGGPAILAGQVAGVFGYPADPRDPCAIGARYFRLDRGADLVERAIAAAGRRPDEREPDREDDSARWTCAPSNPDSPADDRYDDYCDCGCGVADTACTNGCTARGCAARGCDYCADASGVLHECGDGDSSNEPEPGPAREPAEDGDCLLLLRDEWEVDFEEMAPVDTVRNGVECSMARPVRIRSPFHALDGNVSFRGGEIVVECEYALTLAHYVDSLAALGVTSFEHWGAYNCRATASGGVSQHASGTALDLASVTYDGRALTVRRDWADLADVYDAALSVFDSVLGPDYNADHEDHLHLGLRL